jgi:hypothetical protein
MDIAVWLIAVPMAVAQAAEVLLHGAGWHTDLFAAAPAGVISAVPLLLLLQLAVALFQLWGEAAALVVAKRLLTRNAGRARTSFRATARQARGLVIPILGAEILWLCSTVLGLIFFVIPGLVIGTRSVFCDVATVAEGKRYRGALRASAAVVRGHTARTFLIVAGILLTAFIPPLLIDIALTGLTDSAHILLKLLGIILSTIVWAECIVFFETMMMVAYGDAKKDRA